MVSRFGSGMFLWEDWRPVHVNNTICMFLQHPELMQLRQMRVLEEHTYGIVYMDWSPDSTRLAVCGPEDGFEVWIWDVPLGRLETKVSHSNEDSLTWVSWS